MRLTLAFLLSLTLLAGCGGGGSSVLPAPVTPKLDISNAKVVFIGDSITDFWGKDATFNPNWTAFGYPGNTCAEIRPQLAANLASSNFQAAHILCGTNDLWRDSSWTLDMTTIPLSAMIADAKAKGLTVYVGTVPPWGDGATARQYDLNYDSHLANIRAINAWIRSQHEITVVDYNPSLSGVDGLWIPNLTDDGVHPNPGGYQKMRTALLK